MADYGIKILKPTAPPNIDVKNAEKKDLIIISTAESHKLHSRTITTSFSIQNPLGYICFFDTYVVNLDGSCTSTHGYISNSYVYIGQYLGTATNFVYLLYYEGNG